MTEIVSKELAVYSDEVFDAMVARIQARFAAAASLPLFTTDADDLFDVYVSSFPEGAAQQYHRCNSCSQFIRRFGTLVTIDAQYNVAPVMWHEDDAPDSYKPALAAMARRVRRAKVTGVFLSNEGRWGTAVTGDWHHFNVTPPASILHRSRTVTPGQAMAAKREAHGGLRRALGEITLETIEQALNLSTSGALYRGDLVKAPLQWFLDLKRAVTGHAQRDNLTWRAAALAPDDFCHIRGKLAGTLMKDIEQGLPAADIKRNYEKKADPSQYQVAQVAPAAGNIAQAEKLFAELGLAPALERRYARLDEVQTLWRPVELKEVELPATTGSVFGHLQSKELPIPRRTAVLAPQVTLTWAKFRDMVLPETSSIEVLVPADGNRFAALVTAAKADAPPLLQWDLEDARNPMSWYYAGGVDASIRARLQKAGARYEGNDIRFSLVWENHDDLDAHCMTPLGEHIYFRAKQGCRHGGWLDVDANAGGGSTRTPVENIRWETGRAPQGLYRFFVNHFSSWERMALPKTYRAELQVGDQVFHRGGTYGRATGNTMGQEISSFNYTPGRPIECPAGWTPAVASANAWGLSPGTFAKVSGISLSPNLWSGEQFSARGRHVFFLLEGCKDAGQGVGRGFYSEMLKSDLKPVRATLDAYTAAASIAGAEEADACGLGFSDQAPWGVTLRVQTVTGARTVMIDRFD
jgi:hypothetical protein